MSATKWATGFNKQQEYLPAIIKKDTAQGTKSVIRPFLKQRGYVLADMTAQATVAQAHESSRIEYQGKAKQAYKQRNLVFKPIWSTALDLFQFLKNYYGEEHVTSVQDWGPEVATDGKMLYPNDFDGRVIVVEKLLAKQATFTDPTKPSPLETYINQNNVDVAAMGTNLQAAKQANTDANGFADSAKNETALRDAAWKPVFKKIKDIANNLNSIYPKNPTEVGLWGVPIVLNPTRNRDSEGEVLPGETSKKEGVKVGSYMMNTGTIDFNFWSGGKKPGEPKTLKPNEEAVLGKGFSRVMIGNKDPLVKAKYKIYRKK